MSNIYSSYTPPSQSGGFLKIDDGKTVVLRIASEPVIFNSEYQGKTSTRYAWVVYNHTEDCAQVFSQSATFFKNLAVFANDDEYGDPTEYNIKVTRTGTGTDTGYTIVASPKKSPLTASQKEAVEEVDIIKAIQAGPGVSNVFWLNDFANSKTQPSFGAENAIDNGGSMHQNFDMPEDLDEPIDLSEIPF